MADLHQEFVRSKNFNQARMDRRSADALVGIAAGIAADGAINIKEAQFLEDWIRTNSAHLEDPVVNLLFQRTREMLQDGVLDAEESLELLSLLRNFAGLSVAKPNASEHGYTAPNDLPFTRPQPAVRWNERLFVFTGVMACGPRKVCQELVIERGAMVGRDVNKKTDYLVVGAIGNDQWRHATYGLKIMRAVELASEGIAIISEEHWHNALYEVAAGNRKADVLSSNLNLESTANRLAAKIEE